MIYRNSLVESKPSTRERVLIAAERLLAKGSAGFSMRDLADEAGMSFATPFNQFGSKGSIMLALSERLIARMRQELMRAQLPESTLKRILHAVDIAVSVMLAAPTVNRAVMGAIGAPSNLPGTVSARSSALWAEALGPGEDLVSSTRALALATVPDQLAIAFRGVLSFWTAGEFTDQVLQQRASSAAATVLLGFVGREGRRVLLALLEI
jgi:AcrR family transcriptional regulator